MKPKQEMAIYSLLQRRDVMEILSTRFTKSMIFTVFAMAKEEMSRSRHFSRKRPKELKYLFSRNKKLLALRVVKEISTFFNTTASEINKF